MSKLSARLSFFALFLFSVAMYSQSAVVTSVQTGNGADSGSGDSQNSGSVHVSVTANPGMVGVGGLGGGLLSGVKGHPVSADVIEETDQNLIDGNHTHRESHGRFFRDSEGRSRYEFGGQMAGSEPLVHVQIFDPVQNVFIMLDSQSKIALVHYFGERSGPANFEALPSTSQPAPAAQPGITLPAPASGQARIRTVDTPGIAHHSREELGTMEIEGYTVKGTRFTTTVPAGAAGNDKPMTTTEHWFSEELKTDLLIKDTSPWSGQHVRRLVNIHSGDPDPLLFQVPADYTVKDQ